MGMPSLTTYGTVIGWYNLYPMKHSYFRILHTSHSDPTPIQLRSDSEDTIRTPTVPRHSPSHAAFHRRSPRSTEFYRIISEITEILLVIIRYILTTDVNHRCYGLFRSSS